MYTYQSSTESRALFHLAGGISVVGLLCLLGTFLVSGSLFWLAAPKAEPKTLVAASVTVPLAHKRIQDIQPSQWGKVKVACFPYSAPVNLSDDLIFIMTSISLRFD
ncbi:hypothetical protein [Gimesia aquarii]|uniref:hypothetical protein n=1 Tax=Gimesia aquarii TaxID=2527964 RepID=UPI00119D0734|nr:hypothetical protein [Gimesia aquarii]